MSTTTANLGLTLPTPNVDTGWGSTLNTDFTTIDNLFSSNGTGTSIGLQVGSGKTLVLGGTMVLGSGDGTGTVTAPTIRGAARTGTNATGANLTIDAPNGTGTGGSGSIIFRTAPAGSSGSTADTMRNVLEIGSNGSVSILGADISTIVPTGSVTAFAGSSAPTGWLLCAGQSISTSTYAALFAVVGYTYGGGGGAFNLPDLRGRVVAGKDDMGGSSANRLTSVMSSNTLGAAGGNQLHTLTSSEMPAHQHLVANGVNATGTLTSGNYINYQANPGTNNDYTLAGSATGADRGLTSSAGGNGAHNNVQPTFILNYIIKT